MRAFHSHRLHHYVIIYVQPLAPAKPARKKRRRAKAQLASDSDEEFLPSNTAAVEVEGEVGLAERSSRPIRPKRKMTKRSTRATPST